MHFLCKKLLIPLWWRVWWIRPSRTSVVTWPMPPKPPKRPRPRMPRLKLRRRKRQQQRLNLANHQHLWWMSVHQQHHQLQQLNLPRHQHLWWMSVHQQHHQLQQLNLPRHQHLWWISVHQQQNQLQNPLNEWQKMNCKMKEMLGTIIKMLMFFVASFWDLWFPWVGIEYLFCFLNCFQFVSNLLQQIFHFAKYLYHFLKKLADSCLARSLVPGSSPGFSKHNGELYPTVGFSITSDRLLRLIVKELGKMHRWPMEDNHFEWREMLGGWRVGTREPETIGFNDV